MKERILDPLDMDHTGVTLTPWMQEHLAQGSHTPAACRDAQLGYPGAGRRGRTAIDDERHAEVRARESRFSGGASAAADAADAHRSPLGGKDMSIGMNWLIRSMNGREVVWHNGGTGGYRTWLGFDKARKVRRDRADELGHRRTTIWASSWLRGPRSNQESPTSRLFWRTVRTNGRRSIRSICQIGSAAASSASGSPCPSAIPPRARFSSALASAFFPRLHHSRARLIAARRNNCRAP